MKQDFNTLNSQSLTPVTLDPGEERTRGQVIGHARVAVTDHVAAYVEALQATAARPTVKQHLAAIRMLFDWLVVGQVLAVNPAHAVRGPKYVVRRGKTPVLTEDQARRLLESIDTLTPVGQRDRALIGVMTYTFARIGAVGEYVLEYLQHSFPTLLFELYSDEDGNIYSRPAHDADGNPVISREAVECRDRMIEHLASLPPVQGALDQILHRFGTDLVAEVTGRSRRIVRRAGQAGDRLCVESRPASANFAETAAFMDDDKRILVFSDAGGTGRSYHADLGCRNQRRRIHYLLEPGWKADAAIQGLGRSNRTNQKQPPVFRPVATDVKGEKRFLSTIARRLDTLGAITRGQRQTGGQGLFRGDDNLESPYAKAALRQFYQLLYAGKIEGCSLGEFQDATGLDLVDQDGSLKEDLPPITQFLNRILAPSRIAAEARTVSPKTGAAPEAVAMEAAAEPLLSKS
jgi:C-terminal domain on Strawberry notch homologue